MGEVTIGGGMSPDGFIRFIDKVEKGMVVGEGPILVFRPNPDGPGVIQETITQEEMRRRQEANADKGGFVMIPNE